MKRNLFLLAKIAVLSAWAVCVLNCWGPTFWIPLPDVDDLPDAEDQRKLELLKSIVFPRSRIEHKLVDQGDGSVMLSKQWYPSGNVYEQVLIKKCPQGWDYKAALNTCERNVALKNKFQFCSENSNACNDNDGLLIDAGNSEAYRACDLDNSLGFKWSVISEANLLKILIHADRDQFFPAIDNGFYWANGAARDQDVRVLHKTRVDELRMKTDAHHVWCQFRGDFF